MSVRKNLFCLVAIAWAFAAAYAGAESPGGNGGFAVVELFTSEGCSSCPPADEAMSRLAIAAAKENLPVYVLEWHVDYWDYLGWKDPYGSRLATDRQRAYARALPSSVYTPQVVINGSLVEQYAGDQRAIEQTARSLVKTTSAGSFRLQLSVSQSPTSFNVHADAGGASPGSKLLLLLVEDGLDATPTAGENARRPLIHSNVVRSLTVLSPGAVDARIEIPAGVQTSRSRLVGIIQDDRTMRILAADRVTLPTAGATLSGSVIDTRGIPVRGAMVQACNDVVCVPALTDRNGTFVFNGLAPGRYSIAVDSGPEPLAVTLESGRSLVVSRPIILTR
jgi:hypothetical protein